MSKKSDTMKIFVIDDSLDNLSLIENILKESGYTDIVKANSAEETYQLLKIDNPTGTDQQVDLILLDITMPEIDGIETCRMIKTTENLKHTPVIVLTEDTGEKTLEGAFRVGANDFISKPFNKIELLTRVRTALMLKQEMDRRKKQEKELLEITQMLDTTNKILERLSYTDGLTGIANRRYFDECFKQEWKRAMRNVYPLSLILIDIDYFKSFNETYGHQMGDDCLRLVANTINNSVKRDSDIVARYGGEEFIVVLLDTDATGASKIAEKIRSDIVGLKLAHSGSKALDVVSVSLGVASDIPKLHSLPESLIVKADKALYESKKNGRNRVTCEPDST